MPSNTTSGGFYYTYVLMSEQDGKRYIGYTDDLKKRISMHVQGKVKATNQRLPLKLIYFEGCQHPEDAKRREKYLKTSQGSRFLGLRMRIDNNPQKALGAGR